MSVRRADGLKVPIDHGRSDAREPSAPRGIAVFVDDLRTDALDEVMAGNAGKRDAKILLEAFLHAVE